MLILILDEVFASLDETDAHFILNSCKQIPIVFIVRRKMELKYVANRYFIIEKGQLKETHAN